jgi:hypothetical protein
MDLNSQAEWGEPKVEPVRLANEKHMEAELSTSLPKPSRQLYL